MTDPCELCRRAQCPRVCYVQRDFERHHGKTRFTRKNDKWIVDASPNLKVVWAHNWAEEDWKRKNSR